MCEFHESTCNGFGDIWWTDNPIYFSIIGVKERHTLDSATLVDGYHGTINMGLILMIYLIYVTHMEASIVINVNVIQFATTVDVGVLVKYADTTITC